LGEEKEAYQVITEAEKKGIKLWLGDFSEQGKVTE
jgi:hypothetical protein